jgi:endonuclease/exonuclease/phosphatase (EEP) superfamily protein YafD
VTVRFAARTSRGTVVVVAVLLLVGLLVATVALAGFDGPLVAPTTSSTASTSPTPTGPSLSPPSSASAAPQALGLRVTQANLRIGMSRRDFRDDVRRVMAATPDFVTYNEVGLRRHRFLAPGRYRLFRDPGRYSGEAAVAWDSTRWAKVKAGTIMVSHRLGRLWWQRHLWGLRYANWVVVANATTGQVVSLVSVHAAPSTQLTRNVLDPSVTRIGRLVRRLSHQGPVIVAGDFNVAYDSEAFPRRLLARFGLRSTFDLAGDSLPTGNHHGKTIDYVLVSPATRFSVTGQWVQHLHSDHNALTVDLLVTPGPAM